MTLSVRRASLRSARLSLEPSDTPSVSPSGRPRASGFSRLCDDHGVRKIRLHALRHTTASPLKDLGVPPRDAQIILGHSHITTTQQIYMHVDEAARLDAITKLNKLLGGTE